MIANIRVVRVEVKRIQTLTVISKFPSLFESWRFWVMPWTLLSKTMKEFSYTSFKLQTLNKTEEKFIPRTSMGAHAVLVLNKPLLQWITALIAVCPHCEMEKHLRKAFLCKKHRTIDIRTGLVCLYMQTFKIKYQHWTFGTIWIWQNSLDYIKGGNKRAKVKHMHVGLAWTFLEWNIFSYPDMMKIDPCGILWCFNKSYLKGWFVRAS